MSNDPDWAMYRTLLAVLDEGSLSAAARVLGLAQPTVARHIDALETDLGADLFVRSQRGLAPTDLAQALRPHARIMASTAAALLRTASGTLGTVAGTVRVSASDVVGVEHLPPILARLRRDHPALVIELALSDRVDDLLARESDIAVRMTEPTQTALLARRLPPVELGFHAHRDYLARRGTPASVAELHRHDLIGYDAETPRCAPWRRGCRGSTGAASRSGPTATWPSLPRSRAGFGIGLCQVAIARRDPALVRTLPRCRVAVATLDRHARGFEDQRSSPRSVRRSGRRTPRRVIGGPTLMDPHCPLHPRPILRRMINLLDKLHAPVRSPFHAALSSSVSPPRAG